MVFHEKNLPVIGSFLCSAIAIKNQINDLAISSTPFIGWIVSFSKIKSVHKTLNKYVHRTNSKNGNDVVCMSVSCRTTSDTTKIHWKWWFFIVMTSQMCCVYSKLHLNDHFQLPVWRIKPPRAHQTKPGANACAATTRKPFRAHK